MSWKDSYIAKHGEDAYKEYLARGRAYHEAHKEEVHARGKKYREIHPEVARVNDQEACRKGGKRYEQMLEYSQTGISGDKKKIRRKHGHQYRQYKKIIAPDSQIHHQWVPETANYDGVALVEVDQHRHGIIDVIQILEGEITVLTEAELIRGVE